MGQSHVKITSGMGISTLTSIIKKSLKTHKSRFFLNKDLYLVKLIEIVTTEWKLSKCLYRANADLQEVTHKRKGKIHNANSVKQVCASSTTFMIIFHLIL